MNSSTLAIADYLTFPIPPGVHVISAGRSESVNLATFQAGKDYNYKLSFRKVNMLTGTPTPAVLAPISKEQWDEDTKKLEERPAKPGASCGAALASKGPAKLWMTFAYAVDSWAR
jgi:hypothetical protein